jgi:hypothetical protein
MTGTSESPGESEGKNIAAQGGGSSMKRQKMLPKDLVKG